MTTAQSTQDNSLEAQIRDLAQNALKASRALAVLSTEQKNRALVRIAELLELNQEQLLEENRKDLSAGEKAGLSSALLDRLRFTPERIRGMAEGVRQVAALPDPVGEHMEETVRPNGLIIRKVRVPIGVVGIIYESRPNVTIDCASLCLKSGNAAILRGGKEAFHSNTALAEILKQGLSECHIATESVQLVPTTDRKALNFLLKMDDCIHCIIPRGGEGLIRFVAENARMPVIKHYKGVCCIYVDKDADPEQAVKIAVSAKISRPGVCNAAENLFVHEAVASTLLPAIAKALVAESVELRADEPSLAILKQSGIAAVPAKEEDFYEEYLDRILAIKIVANLDDAIHAVNQYGSQHSDAILTRNKANAEKFLCGVDSSTVYWNASTRFTDGFEFGLGAEIGISTDKLHARGPMGPRELTTYKYHVFGTGQIK